MAYRKFRADQLFTGHEMAAEDAVLIIREDGLVEAVLPAGEAGEDVESLRGILSPGFINCHCHLELSHMKGVIPEGTGLVDFLLNVIRGRGAAGASGAVQDAGQSPGGRVAGEGGRVVGADELLERKLAAIAAAEAEMLQGGIVAVGDICNTSDSLEQKKGGNLLYHNFIETMGFAEQGAADRFGSSLRVFQAFAEAYPLPIAANSIVPHAPYSVSARLFGLIAGFPGNQLLTIHNQEDEAENVFCLSGRGDFLRLYGALGLDVSFFRGTGKRSLESWLPHFYPGQSLILVHNVATSEEDLRFARGWKHLFFCLCPNANLYISGRLPDPDLLMRYDCQVVLGTDSLASNHRLSILEEIKTLQRKFPLLPTATLLQWATLNGARALQLDGVLGSFSPGKQPGVLLIEDEEGGESEKERKIGSLAAVRRLI
ncbi:MAG TPA: amidohydrolase family protein [Puia sp.]|nr:amidohydrolase family protein [Puia sp.]